MGGGGCSRPRWHHPEATAGSTGGAEAAPVWGPGRIPFSESVPLLPPVTTSETLPDGVLPLAPSAPPSFTTSSSSSSSSPLHRSDRQRAPSGPLRCPPFMIGLTGGIACGKSSVCSLLRQRGAAVVDCDSLAHRSYERGTPTYTALMEAFGPTIRKEGGAHLGWRGGGGRGRRGTESVVRFARFRRQHRPPGSGCHRLFGPRQDAAPDWDRVASCPAASGGAAGGSRPGGRPHLCG